MATHEFRNSRMGRFTRRPLLHHLEDRTAPALFTVNTLADTNTGVGTSGSLRYVVGLANATPETDTITFTVSGTITLDLTLGPIEISKGLEINGPGAAGLTISGNDAVQIFKAVPVAPIDVALSDLTLSKGKAQVGLGEFGGAFDGTDVNLKLNNVVVSNNTGDADGGAINLLGGSLSVTGSTFSNNKAISSSGAVFGGAVFLDKVSTAKFANSTFSGNVSNSLDNSYAYGGAVSAAGTTTLSFVNSTFTNNHANGEGGAIQAADTAVSVTGSKFSGNTAKVAGGAIEILGTGTLNVGTSTFENNKSLNPVGSFFGGAIFLDTSGKATITDTSFTNNDAIPLSGKFGFGGAIAQFKSSPLALSRVTIQGSDAVNGNGGAIWAGTAGTELTIDQSSLIQNTAGSAGGTIWVSSGASGINSVAITNTTFSKNSSGNAGGVYGTNGGDYPILFRNSTFDGNNAAAPGGMFISFGSYIGVVTVENSTITDNNGASAGGGIGLFSAGTVNIVSSVVAGNSLGGSKTINDFVDLRINVVGGLPVGTMTVNNSLVGVVGAVPQYTGANNLTGTKAAPLNPMLEPLLNYGGLTPTRIPMPGSPVINAGSNPVALVFDQRGTGFPREFSGKTDIGAVEAFNPTPFVSVVNAPAVTTAGATTYEFSVTFQDDTGIDVSTLATPGAISVSGGGFGAPVAANFVKVDVAGNGSPRTATYAITPPGGGWDLADNGSYTINLKADTIFDTDTPTKLSVPGGPIGSFLVGIPVVFVVDTDLDVIDATDGKLSFREAVIAANASAGADTITFDPTFFAADSTISYTLNTIQITDSVSIMGPANAKLTLDANFASKHITISSGTKLLNVDISRLTFANGLETTVGFGFNGGSVNIGDENVTFTGCTFINNQGVLDGGAIGHVGTGTLTLINCVFENNATQTGKGFNGGAVHQGSSNAVLVIVDSQFINNSGDGGGGAINAGGKSTTITGSKFLGNTSTGGEGGAIFQQSAGALTITDSTISGNFAGAAGGGIYFFFNGSLSLTRSTVSGNVAGTDGGGIYFFGNTANFLISNSTLSGNKAGGAGGGIALKTFTGTAAVQNSTIAFNEALNGGGIARISGTGTVALSSTIVAQNSAGSDLKAPTANLQFDAPSSIAGKNNLIGVNDVASNATFADAPNLIGSVASPIDPLLNPLANNKGLTETHSLKAGSPALNAGNNLAGLTSDQRGGPYVRVFGTQADIGAFEDQPLDPAITATVKVDDGTNQRSRVTSLTVTFSAPVTFVGAPEAAFQLVQAGTANAVTLAAAVAGPVVTLTFGGPLTEATSLKDGNYQLTVFASQIVGSFNGGGGPGSNLVFGPTSGNKGLYRLFGDADGDRDVDFNDFLAFRGVFGTPATPTGPGYFFNFDGNASIDFADFLAFRTRFGTALAP